MSVRVFDATSVDELVKLTVSFRDQVDEGGFLWYRGVDTDRHALLPKLLREGKSSEAVLERERRLITRFRQRGYAYWPAGYPQGDWDQLFAMQHYGLPTRLLDWTENLFVAAYFALFPTREAAPSRRRPEARPPHVPVIWVVNPIKWNQAMPVLSEYGATIQVLTTADEDAEPYRPQSTKKRPKSPVAIYGTHNSARIVAQRGTFMVWGADTTPLEKVETGSLMKIRLVGDRQSMRRDLRFLGFTETMIFPELTSLATEISEAEGWRV